MQSHSESNVFRPVLEALRAESGRYFGVPDVVLEPFEPDVRRFSNVLRVRVQAGAVCSQIFVKVHKPQRGGVEEDELLRKRVANEFSTAMRVRAHFARHAGLSAVRPIACFPEHLAIVTEGVGGDTLLQLLARRAAWRPGARTLERLCLVTRSVGTWLRIFQQIEAPGRRLSFDKMRAYIDLRLQLLVRSRHAGFSEKDRQAILRFVDDQRERVTDQELDEVMIHADLSLSNVLVDGTRITVIDFGEPKYDAVYHDVTHVLTQIDLLSGKPQFSRSVVERLQAALLEGFDSTLDPRQPLFQLLRLKHVLCHYLTLATRPVPTPERMYNWYVQRRHQNWLNALVEESGRPWWRPASNEASNHRAVWP